MLHMFMFDLHQRSCSILEKAQAMPWKLSTGHDQMRPAWAGNLRWSAFMMQPRRRAAGLAVESALSRNWTAPATLLRAGSCAFWKTWKALGGATWDLMRLVQMHWNWRVTWVAKVLSHTRDPQNTLSHTRDKRPNGGLVPQIFFVTWIWTSPEPWKPNSKCVNWSFNTCFLG